MTDRHGEPARAATRAVPVRVNQSHFGADGHALTERQRREREYYRAFRAEHQVEKVNLAPILGEESRPWNEYWNVYETVKAVFEHPRQRILDFGCGPGADSVLYAKIGYETYGFDLCPENIANGRFLARKYGLEDRIRFSVQVAEQLAYPDETFDLVCGVDILHHVEIRKAVPEAWRVLKPGGLAIFREWVEVPIFDAVRRSAPVRSLYPTEASIERHVTHDERKLSRDEVAFIRSSFRDVEIRNFYLSMRLTRLFSGLSHPILRALSKLDQRILGTIRFTRPFAGCIVFVMRK